MEMVAAGLAGIGVIVLVLLLRRVQRLETVALQWQEVQNGNTQQLLDLLTVRLPEPSPTEIRARAEKAAAKVGAEREVMALHALHRAAVRLGNQWSDDPADDNLTASDLDELSRHFEASSLIAKGWGPQDAARRTMLGRDYFGATPEEVAALSPTRRERAKRIAAQLSAMDADDIVAMFERDLIRRGALTID
jgi:hypothetical protein